LGPEFKLQYQEKEEGGGESRWQIADRLWNFDLNDFKQLLQIFMAARIGLVFSATQDSTNTERAHNIFD
jgi:hypothetical protein